MQKYLQLFLFSFALYQCSAQKATLNIKIAHTNQPNFQLLFSSTSLPWSDKYVKWSTSVDFKQSEFTTYNIPLNDPQFITLICYADATHKDMISYPLFLSPNDNLQIEADFSKIGYAIKVTGKGHENNQAFNDILSGFDSDIMYGDTTPTRIIDSLKKYNHLHEELLEKYINTFHPMPTFITALKNNTAYYAPYVYYSFEKENILRIRDTINGTSLEWEKKIDSIFSLIRLNNDEALITPNYRDLISTFLQRKKGDLWWEYYDNPDSFLRQWYKGNGGKGHYLSDKENILTEKIISKYFHGKTSEYAYALLFDIASYHSRIQNIPEIFLRFKQKYPNSKYIKAFKPWIDDIDKKNAGPLSKNIMLFGKGNKLNTLDAIHNILKGKVGLLYVWGTWCSPCRTELVTNIPLITKHFKDKNVAIVFIALHDQSNEKRWKELIKNLDLQGIHILSNQQLETELTTKAKVPGASTYLIMQKNGTIKLSDSGHHSDILINEIDSALQKD